MAKTWKQLIEEISNSDEYIKANIKLQEELIKEYDKEIRKPLEDEIVELSEFVSRLISEKEPETAREVTERHHREIMLERKNKFLEEEIERLKKENKRLIKDNKLLDETKYTAQQDDIDFFVEQERQKVIAELEEWALKEKYSGWTTLDDLKQKLNEMKEV